MFRILQMFLLIFMSYSIYAESSINEGSGNASKTSINDTNVVDKKTTNKAYTTASGKEITKEDLEKEKGVFSEEGKYKRQAVSYIDALMVLKGVYNVNMNKVYNKTIKLLDENLHLGRFDYVILPESVKRDFIRSANQQSGKMTPESLIDLTAEKLLPEMRKVLEATADIRGAENVSDAQKQSMIAVKAKEIGLTEGQIIQLMNSAYLYIPVIRGVNRVITDNTISYYVDLGVVWYQVKTEKNEVVIKKKIFPTSTVGFASRDKKYSAYGGPDNFALEAALSAAVKNLVVETKKIPDFTLSGQLISKSGNDAKIEIGTKEGVKLDDKFTFVMLSEDSLGKESYKELGYGFINHVGKNKKNKKEEELEFDPSSYHIVKNNSFIEAGIVAMEYPRLGVNIGFGYDNFPVSMSDDWYSLWKIQDNKNASGRVNGLYLDINVNVGKYIGVSQLYLTAFGYTIGLNSPIDNFTFDWGLDTYTFKYESFSRYQFLGLTKKFYLGRSAIDINMTPEYMTSTLKIESDFNSVYETDEFSAFSIALGGAYEYSVLKNLDIRGTLGMSLFDTDDMVDYGGLRFGFQLVYSPGMLPFDPMAIIKGYLSN